MVGKDPVGRTEEPKEVGKDELKDEQKEDKRADTPHAAYDHAHVAHGRIALSLPCLFPVQRARARRPAHVQGHGRLRRSTDR